MRFFRLITLGLAFWPGLPACANLLTWTGGGADANWNDAANWGTAGIPGNGDTLIFLGTSNLITTNNLANLTLAQIHFGDAIASIHLHGNAITLTNALIATNTTSFDNFIDTDVALPTNDLAIYAASGSSLVWSGSLSGPGGLILSGPGTNQFSGSTSNTCAGTTTLNGGILLLNKSSGVALPGNLVINSPGVVRLGNDFQTANASDVLVNAGGLLDFSTHITFLDTLRGYGTVNFGVGAWAYLGVNDGSSEFDGDFTGIGFNSGFTVGKTGSGIITLTGAGTFTAGNMHVFEGILIINGSQPRIPITVDSDATLGGTGLVGSLTGFGNLAPGPGPGILNSSNVIFHVPGNFSAVLNGTNAGTGYSQLNVTGTVALNNATLQINGTSVGAVGSQYTVINNDGSDAILGTFAGLPEGSTVASNNGILFTISYHGGTGNDVVLTQTSLPPPPMFTGIQKLPGGIFQLTGTGLTNQSYTVWAGTNLTATNWITLGTTVAPSNSNTFQFNDLAATNYLRRFYRLSWP